MSGRVGRTCSARVAGRTERFAQHALGSTLRAVGIVRHEPTLIQRAIDRFERLGLPWHATRTRALA